MACTSRADAHAAPSRQHPPVASGAVWWRNASPYGQNWSSYRQRGESVIGLAVTRSKRPVRTMRPYLTRHPSIIFSAKEAAQGTGPARWAQVKLYVNIARFDRHHLSYQ